ncbi:MULTISPECIES: FliM/FliN family flagellar motor C-terminal domain-containing protein [unclassified Mameliella]|uniref:FliM/FliN family flagellar motor switch protein n=1 Tax=unclassified Mameliella TaxID=2630630 RepID=UPI00273FBEF7|nr:MULTISPECIES: FliM/FliN family flagellar motor C-terminal domain-containing protein [unclassified Mameliella]
MADGARNDVLGQKAQAAQRAYEARGMSLPKALRRALSRTADVLWDLALVTQSVTVEMLDQDEVVEALGPRDLLILLDGPEGALGLVSVDRQVLTGVVEVQTIQQVTQMPVEEDRILTQTDAAMMAPLIDGALTRLAGTMEGHPLHPQLDGYRFGAMLEDSRAAGLILDAAAYRAFRAEIDLALGRRRGRMTIFLPERKLSQDRTEAGAGVGPHEERLSRVAARLDAKLARITLPLGRAEALKPGDLLTLPPDALDKVEVTAGRGDLVARGRLGQLNGLRAVRLNWPSTGVTAASLGMAADADPVAEAGAGPGAPAAVPEPVVPDLPQVAEPAGEELPDLPPMDFDGGDFDFSDLGEDSSAEGGGEPMAALPEIDMGDGFDAAPLDFDFEED